LLRGRADGEDSSTRVPPRISGSDYCLETWTSECETATALHVFPSEPFWRRAARPGTASRAATCWRIAEALALRDIPTARPLALAEFRGDRLESCLATEHPRGAIPAIEFLNRLGARSDDSQSWLQTVRALGRLLGRLHRWELRHRRLHARAVWLRADAEEVAAYFIDLVGIRIQRSLSPRERAADLSQLAAWFPLDLRADAELSEALGRAYLHAYRDAHGDWRELWPEVNHSPGR
ncbi:MAG: lipopolysaccharide kinase InaA family protein, partial [Planctomycetales bacterium]